MRAVSRRVVHLSIAGMCALGLTVALCTVLSAGGTVRTAGTEIKVCEVRPSLDPAKGVDKRLTRGMRTALYRCYKDKFPSYTIVDKHAIEAKLGKDAKLVLSNSDPLILRVFGYTPSSGVIDVKIQMKEDITATSLGAGRFWCGPCEDGDTPLTLIITANLIQTER